MLQNLLQKLLCKMHVMIEVTAEDAETTSIVNTAVSCDGLWHRQGHSSLNGVVTVISMKNGKY